MHSGFILEIKIVCHLAAQFLAKLLLSLSYRSLGMVTVSRLNISESLLSGT